MRTPKLQAMGLSTCTAVTKIASQAAATRGKAIAKAPIPISAQP
jgi:hypothetical protein